MAKKFLLAVCLLSTLGVWAQENVEAPHNTESGSLVHRNIEGCLAYNGVSYVLGVVGNGPKQYRVVGGDIQALRGKLGHTVAISGMAGKNNPAEMVRNWDMREATTGVGWNTITAEKVQDITSNCSYEGYEKPGM